MRQLFLVILTALFLVSCQEQETTKEESPTKILQLSNASITLLEDEAIDLDLTKQVEGASGSVEYTITAETANGTLSGKAPYLRYTPNANFHGEDYF